MSNIDLSNLRHSQPIPTQPRRPLGRHLLAASVLGLAIAVAGTFAWPWLRPLRSVTMVAIRTAATPTGQAGGTGPEAVGWIEADPFPTLVRPLVAGRVESILVLEGRDVEAGVTTVASLQSASLQAAVERATAQVHSQNAELSRTKVELELARARLLQNSEFRRLELQATTALADVTERLARATGSRERAAAMLTASEASWLAQQRLAEAGDRHRIALARAAAEAQAASAEAASAAAMQQALTEELAARQHEHQLAVELRDNPVDLRYAVELAERAVDRSAAMLASAVTELTIAEREAAWTKVLAPISGKVLRLLASPGSNVGPDQDAILALYDPKLLRARIDVPLGSVSGIEPGQAVELSSEVTGAKRVRGIVQRLQHESDLLKNTLQVKVQLIDPPDLWRPETLVRARFQTGRTSMGTESTPTFVLPGAAIRDGLVHVFVPDTQRARAVIVTTVGKTQDGVLVQGELSPAQRVILDPVQNGERVQELRQ